MKAPDQKTLAELAAKLAPQMAMDDPKKAVLAAARLWAHAGEMAAKYSEQLKAADDYGHTKLWFMIGDGKEARARMCGEAEERADSVRHLLFESDLLEYVRSKCEEKRNCWFQSLSNLKKAIAASPQAHCLMDGIMPRANADSFIEYRHNLDTLRKRRSRAALAIVGTTKAKVEKAAPKPVKKNHSGHFRKMPA